MNLEEGKNYKLINEFGRFYDLHSPGLGKEYPIRIYGKFDLLVDGKTTRSPEDFWMVTLDLDGTTFAQPVNATILAQKLMTLAFIPLQKKNEVFNVN